MSRKNSQALKLRKLARKNHAVVASDPDGLLSTLQVTKRLLTDSQKNGTPTTIMIALENALDMSAPKDRVRTWWATYRVLYRNTAVDKSSHAILSDAIKGQGTVNQKIAQGVAA